MSTMPHEPVTSQPLPGPPKAAIPLPLIIIGVVVVAGIGIAILAFLAAPAISAGKNKGDMAVAVENGKNLGIALSEFQMEFGSFPCDMTAETLINEKGDTKFKLNQLKGTYANDYFRQLIVAGIAHSEDPFWTKTPYSPEPPDNNMEGDGALQAGEVGFGYIMYGDDGLGDDDPNRTIAMAPLPSANSGFDPTRLDDQWVLVYLDSSVRVETYAPDRKAKGANRRPLSDTGDSASRGAAGRPVIKGPKMR